MRGKRAKEIDPLSYPSKMDCRAWGVSAAQCHVSARLSGVVGSTCEGCYALSCVTAVLILTALDQSERICLLVPLVTPRMRRDAPTDGSSVWSSSVPPLGIA